MISIPSSKCIYSMNPHNPPAAEVNPGEIVHFETKDCFSNQIQTERDLFAAIGWATVNPATGPLAIRGSRPGDVLAVRILDIKVAQKGSMVAVPEMGALGSVITHPQTKIIPIVDGYAIFNEKLRIPVSPMIGVIGTAPRTGDIPNGTPGPHGGNIDTKLVAKGATVYLPVFIEGAKLAVGDLHAVMADGEVLICGVEVPGEVTLQVDLVKEKSLRGPVLENDEGFYCIASAANLDRATGDAIDFATEFLKARLPLSINEIVMLMSISCNLQISQIVDPLKTARVEIPKEPFRAYGLSF